MRWQRGRVESIAAFGLWAKAGSACSPRAVSAAELCAAAKLHQSALCFCQRLWLCPRPTTEDLFLIHLLKTGFKPAPFAYACKERPSYLRRAGKSVAKPQRREREGGRVLCKAKAKRRNEWENKWITDRMWVSASRKISLWLPRQREVPVGSAPDITRRVCAPACSSEIIDMQNRKQVFVSIGKRWFNVIWFWPLWSHQLPAGRSGAASAHTHPEQRQTVRVTPSPERNHSWAGRHTGNILFTRSFSIHARCCNTQPVHAPLSSRSLWRCTSTEEPFSSPVGPPVSCRSSQIGHWD